VEPLHRVTIIPRGPALGATMQLPEKDRYIMPRQNVLGTVKMLFAGRVSEAMFCDDISSGARDDIRRATDLINKMVREWGMSEAVGPVSYADSEEKLEAARSALVTINDEARDALRQGERAAGRIADQVRRRIDAADGVNLEYVAVVDPDTLADLERVEGKVLVAVAAEVGKTRLIDNVLLRDLE
jgi:cell division protease FtsH